jgi:alpha-1,2-glucosyltransferase
LKFSKHEHQLTILADYAKAIISIAACAAKLTTQPQRIWQVIKTLQPFIALLASFVAFVFINGGVVLGDKSNHVPAIHTPQLLYLWPYLVFFSWPFAYQHLIRVPLTFIAQLPMLANLEHFLLFKRRALLPRVLVCALFISIALLAVRFNTIVHPFTLADNRHSVFYAFRLLRRRWWIPYAATPAYIACAWLSIQALGSAPQDRTKPSGPADPKPLHEQAANTASRGSPRRLLPLPDTTQSANTSFLLIWLATTSLTLITAPLVEPRYFILPWIFFRLHLPLSQPQISTDEGGDGGDKEPFTLLAKLWSQHDKRLWLETVWFGVVNAGTMWLFLHRGFEWEQEPGRVQRFMW